jgi:hypothetical protein
MPPDFLTEEGPRPDFAELYGAVEPADGGSPQRARANARDSDATAWFGGPDSPGGRTTLRAWAKLGRPVYPVIDGLTRPQPTDDVRIFWRKTMISARGLTGVNSTPRWGTPPAFGAVAA